MSKSVPAKPLWYRVTFPQETAFQTMRRYQDPVAAMACPIV